MSDCPNAEMRDRLPDLLHEQLDASTRAAVMAHVADCHDCREELTVLRDVRIVMSSGARVLDVTTVARLVIERVPARRRMRSGASRRINWRIAASVLFLAVGGTSFVMLHGGREAQRAPRPAVTMMRPAPGVDAAATPTPESVASAPGAAKGPARELSAGVAVSELSDSELRALVNDLQSLDALPSADPDPVSVRVAVPGSLE